MLDEIISQLEQQQETLLELEDELEEEISKVISLKNSIDPELIEDLEKIEEGLYVEVKMIHETKKNIETILKKFETKNGEKNKMEVIEKKEHDKLKEEVEKYKVRSERIAKQLIQANEEIEELNSNMENELKKRESKMKNELITKLKDQDTSISEKLIEAQREKEQLINELEGYKTQGHQGTDEVERIKDFFEKKIKNLKKSMTDDLSKREKEIAEKAILVYNKKKEKIYYMAVKEALKMNDRPAEVDHMLSILRNVLDLADDLFGPENFFLCEDCGDVIHISNPKCSTCKAEYTI